ncbi:MAG TPA: SMI1/KNR4 family protein [Acidimicrobiales bacterium]|nr:SMI1/KNR4 family protein [Acidimicrobiales bacterium]
MASAPVLPDGMDLVEVRTGIRFAGTAEALLGLRSELWGLACSPPGTSVLAPAGWELLVTQGLAASVVERQVAMPAEGWIGFCQELKRAAFAEGGSPVDSFYPALVEPSTNSIGVLRYGPAGAVPAERGGPGRTSAPLLRANGQAAPPVERAAAMLDGAAGVVARGRPATADAVGALEQAVGAALPPSYRRFLLEVEPLHIEYDNGLGGYLLVYGLTGTTGLPNVAWAYSLRQTAAANRFLEVATHSDSGAGLPARRYALDLSSISAGGETAVLEAIGRPYEAERSLVAEDFGSWLLSTIEAVLPLAVQTLQARDAYPRHRAYTGAYGQPGPPVFHSICECGWESHLVASPAQAREAAELHSVHPGGAQAQPFWASTV